MDNSAVVISKGKSLLQTDIAIRALPTAALPTELPAVDAQMAQSWRSYLLLAKQLPFAINEQASKVQHYHSLRSRQLCSCNVALNCRI